MPKNQPAMPQATLLRRSGKTIQPWGASWPVLACISISDDSIMVKLLLIVARVVVCLRALLYQISVTIQSCFHLDSSLPAAVRRDFRLVVRFPAAGRKPHNQPNRQAACGGKKP